MPLAQPDFRYGLRKNSGAPISLVAATTPLVVYTMPGLINNALAVGSRSDFIRKIHIFNGSLTTTQVQIGTGGPAGLGSFTQALPNYTCIAGFDRTVEEVEIPDVEFFVPITAQATVAGAAGLAVVLLLELEEYEGGVAPGTT